MSPGYSPADWIWENFTADSVAQIGPVCLCYLIPVESSYPAGSCFISAPAHLLKAVNSQPLWFGQAELNPEPVDTLRKHGIYEQYLLTAAKKL